MLLFVDFVVCFQITDMKYHIHIPNLEDFALYAACDGVALYGIKGLPRTVPLPVYLRCLVTFVKKHSKLITIKKLYDKMRGGALFRSLDAYKQLSSDAATTMMNHMEISQNTSNADTNATAIRADVIVEDPENVLEGGDVDIDDPLKTPHTPRLGDSPHYQDDHEQERERERERQPLEISIPNSLFDVIMRSTDTDGVVECMRRFASQCIDNGYHEELMWMMSSALAACPRKSIRDILIRYGGRLSERDDDHLTSACLCGLHDEVQHILIDEDLSTIYEKHDVYACAISSGDIDTVKLVADAMKDERVLVNNAEINLRDFSIEYAENLLSMGVLKHNNEYRLVGIRSVPVLAWFVKHGMVNQLDRLLVDVADMAVTHGGPYIDVLHYLIEHLHVPVPRELIREMALKNVNYLSALETLNACGAAVKNVNIEQSAPLLMRYWLDKGLDLHAKCHEMVMMFMHEEWRPLAPLVVLLTQYDMDVNIADKHNITPLHVACERQNLYVVRMLLDLGANVNACDENGNTPLYFASGRIRQLGGHTGEHADYDDYIAILRLLLYKGANARAVNSKGQAPLHVVCKERCLEAIQMLIEHGADVNAVDNDGISPLLQACPKGNVRVNLLLMSDTVMRGYWGAGPIVKNGHDIIHVLLNAGADVNVTDSHGDTPLVIACAQRSPEVVRMLLTNGAHVNHVNKDGKSPLLSLLTPRELSRSDHLDMHFRGGREFINEANNVIVRHPSRPSHGVKYEIAHYLLQHDADVQAREKTGKTALHLACQIQSNTIVSMLLDNHASVNATDNNGQTPLHIVCANGFSSIVETLLGHGADVMAIDHAGQTPLMLALAKRSQASLRVLCDCGADAQISDDVRVQLTQVLNAPPPSYMDMMLERLRSVPPAQSRFDYGPGDVYGDDDYEYY